MIKINLLPQKRKRAERAEGSQLWLAVVMVLLLAEVAGLFVFPILLVSLFERETPVELSFNQVSKI